MLLGAGAGTRFGGATPKLLAPWGSTTVAAAAIDSARAAEGVDEVIVVAGAVDLHGIVDQLGGDDVPAWVRHHASWELGVSSSCICGLAEARIRGHDIAIVGFADQPDVPTTTWAALAASTSPAVVARDPDGRTVAVRLAMKKWDTVAAEGDVTIEPSLAAVLAVDRRVTDVDTPADLVSPGDLEWVEACLGRPPRAPFAVAARDAAGRPSVIANPPFLDDGTPMPTRFWLVDPDLHRRIGGLESDGGVDAAEEEIGLDALAEAHDRHRLERDAMIAPDHTGPRPSGGVGGTRVGIKCLHTHYAWYLAGGDDPVGAWVQARLDAALDPEGDIA